jgi:hypothetical protein
MSPFVKAIAEVESVGGTVDQYWYGGKHGRLRWRIGERLWTETIPLSPSDRRAGINFRAQLRRRARAA